MKTYHFPVYIVTIVRETNPFITIIQLTNPNYSWKNGIKRINATQKYCRKGVSSTILLRPQTLTMGSRCNKSCFLQIYYHLSYTWVDLICSTYLLFFKSTWCLVWTFCTQNILEGGSILSSRVTIFKELLFLVASVSECL